MLLDDNYWMKYAFKLAETAYEKKEIPVGAIVVLNQMIIGKGYNQVEMLKDATAHAEMLAITSAANYLNSWRLEGATLYVTKEPCLMCAGAILNSRISKVVYGLRDENDGAAGSRFDVMREYRKWFVEINGGVMLEENERLFKSFFQNLRNGIRD